MTFVRIREFEKLEYRRVRDFLIRLRRIEYDVANSKLPSKVRQLRTNSLKPWRELRDGALFCYGMEKRIGSSVYIARGESLDYDFVASWISDDCRHYSPVQLKELVPKHLNSAATVQSTVDLLKKYPDSEDLTVAIKLNRRCNFDPKSIHIPTLHLGGLWFFGSVSEDQSQWILWGDFLREEVEAPILFGYPS